MLFSTFSPKQKLVLKWWSLPEYKNFDALICTQPSSVTALSEAVKHSACLSALSAGQWQAFKILPLLSAVKPLLRQNVI